jgi:6-phosphofructokinase 1
MKLSAGDRVALITSGGDAPGMNAAVRAATLVGLTLGLDVVGVAEGYKGLIGGNLVPLDPRVLDDAARRGGTWLGTARSKEFPTPEGQAKARETIAREKIKALLVIGGNGSLTGMQTLVDVVRTAGVPASIDNDLAATRLAIGVDTAMNTIVEAIDRICDTAAAHRRAFIVEVMGRDCGYLAMTSAVAAGADSCLVPETGRSEEALVEQAAHAIQAAFTKQSGKRRVIIVKSEGVKMDSTRLKAAVDERVRQVLPDVDTRVTVLGHVVRGGAPSAFDRLLAARLANCAMRALADGETGFMAGWMGPGITRPPCAYDHYVALTPIDEVLRETAKLMSGDTPVAKWRRKVFEDIDVVLSR